MTRLDDLAGAATAAPIAKPPSMEELRKRARRHRLRVVASTATVVLVVGGIAFGIAMAPNTSGSASRSIVATPGPDAASASDLRPVLDNCTATFAREYEVHGSSFTQPSIPTEVFADPARGASGPLAAALLTHGNGTPSAPDGNAGGLIANGDVQGRDAHFQMSGGLQGGASWDLADGGSALVYTRVLSMDELHVLVSELDAGTRAFPQGLRSVGMAGDAQIGSSTCADTEGLIAQIKQVKGSIASRYGEMIITTEGAHTFDAGDSSIAIEAFPGRFGADDTKYHQATSEEWARLLGVDGGPATTSTTAPSSDGPRPVLDGCTTTSARQAVVDASWFDPVPAEVFADPARGVSGPVVVFQRGSGALLPTGDGNAAGGKIANAQVNGRDADVEFFGTYGGVNWDSSSGGSSLLEQQGLTDDEMRAVAEQLDAGTAALPQGLVSLGMTNTVTVSTSECHNQQGQSASITEIHGDQASRYSEVFSTTPRNATARQFDQDNATLVIVTDKAGAFDIANATYHEATPEEWRLICLGAGSSCDGTRPTTTTAP
jgi:hypothetical protein